MSNEHKENVKPERASDLVKPTEAAAIELTESELTQVAGGRVKSADKAFKAMDKFIKG